MDTTSLRQGYGVAANDELLAEATENVLNANRRPYYNHDAVDDARLAEIVAAYGSLEALTVWLEKTSNRFVDLAARLEENLAQLRALRV